MKKTLIFFFVTSLVLFISCNDNKIEEEYAGPLEGVWELVSGNWETQDTSFKMPSPGVSMKSIKYYSKGRVFVIGQDAPIAEYYSLAGTYSIDGNKCTEVIQINSISGVPTSSTIDFSIEGDQLTLESDWFSETWKRIE